MVGTTIGISMNIRILGQFSERYEFKKSDTKNDTPVNTYMSEQNVNNLINVIMANMSLVTHISSSS